MRRVLMIVLAFLFVLSMIPFAGAAEKYPVKPVSFIVPLEAGSDGDLAARPLMEKDSVTFVQCQRRFPFGTLAFRPCACYTRSR